MTKKSFEDLIKETPDFSSYLSENMKSVYYRYYAQSFHKVLTEEELKKLNRLYGA